MPEERKLLGSSRISTANQITLPKEVRDKLKVESGDVIGFYLEPDGKITLDR
ncbi:MAG: AbrB/MazE/SpoVT family DNA-binding domain-containing protein [Candidatus Helarchaeota archaeon]|nr:AbrB/MazE/SpoVT family DNA-binding domain-containing protein [Candidatus Helarchaeota archaeon]